MRVIVTPVSLYDVELAVLSAIIGNVVVHTIYTVLKLSIRITTPS
jgi:hypothetical protein